MNEIKVRVIQLCIDKKRRNERAFSVSYTHLDVYKRQVIQL